ncbi:hypothetical protein N0V90_001033 [Kalmusia sp. IMI 367209]|nr:hypothetical protein N0V90_001033 [Kalmusia sp. IMI 367209]
MASQLMSENQDDERCHSSMGSHVKEAAVVAINVLPCILANHKRHNTGAFLRAERVVQRLSRMVDAHLTADSDSEELRVAIIHAINTVRAMLNEPGDVAESHVPAYAQKAPSITNLGMFTSLVSSKPYNDSNAGGFMRDMVLARDASAISAASNAGSFRPDPYRYSSELASSDLLSLLSPTASDFVPAAAARDEWECDFCGLECFSTEATSMAAEGKGEVEWGRCCTPIPR